MIEPNEVPRAPRTPGPGPAALAPVTETLRLVTVRRD